MRIAVIGSSGSGKTSFAAALAHAQRVPHIELDAVSWQPGWVALHQTDPVEFERRAAALMAQDAWVACGNYIASCPPLLARATDLVWLDFPRRVVMARVVRRSFVRAVTRTELWPGTGNREEFHRWLDREHPIRWAWDTFDRRRAQYEALFADPSLTHIRKHRLRRPNEAGGLIAMLANQAAPPAADRRGRAGTPA